MDSLIVITRVGVWISIVILAVAVCGGVAGLGVVIGIDPAVDCVVLARIVSLRPWNYLAYSTHHSPGQRQDL